VVFDIVVAGGGPAGLSFAASLAGSGLKVAVVERTAATELANPPFDGREIALTHRSVGLLKGLGAWERIPPGEVSEMREARVLNGPSTYFMSFDPGRRGDMPLGHLVANHLIRRAVHDTALAAPEVTLMAGVAVTAVRTSPAGAEMELADGRTLRARLAVAADTRFSELRRRQGIPARMLDFGRVMMVCRVEHELPHDHVATEWFDYGQTIATLPINGNACSFVLTLPAREMEAVMAMTDAEFGAEATRRYRGRLGEMKLVSTRHAYPLVAVYAQRFAATRFALVGDAAVGMHPVTAHGFNFGLRGADALARRVRRAAGRGADIGAAEVLLGYEREHRLATWPTYAATNATARLYADDRLPARVLRDAVLRLGSAVSPVRELITAHLMESGRPRLA
jgi:ubiquinone biosynthesis UbiH/UbiF/VisC/COQ6 family hydroxylase